MPPAAPDCPLKLRWLLGIWQNQLYRFMAKMQNLGMVEEEVEVFT